MKAMVKMDIDELDSILNIGNNDENVSVNLAEIPHVFIGGPSGTNKTDVLKKLIWQAIKKGIQIDMIHFNGGVLIGEKLYEHVNVTDSYEKASYVIQNLAREVKLRKKKFHHEGVKSFCEYSTLTNEKLERKILVLDEAMTVLDDWACEIESGRSRQIENIKALEEITGGEDDIGIHLIMMSYMPNVWQLSGQLKENITCKMISGIHDPKMLEDLIGKNDIDISDLEKNFYIKTINGISKFRRYIFEENREKSGSEKMNKKKARRIFAICIVLCSFYGYVEAYKIAKAGNVIDSMLQANAYIGIIALIIGITCKKMLCRETWSISKWIVLVVSFITIGPGAFYFIVQ
jgi:hypothetical protein